MSPGTELFKVAVPRAVQRGWQSASSPLELLPNIQPQAESRKGGKPKGFNKLRETLWSEILKAQGGLWMALCCSGTTVSIIKLTQRRELAVLSMGSGKGLDHTYSGHWGFKGLGQKPFSACELRLPYFQAQLSPLRTH